MFFQYYCYEEEQNYPTRICYKISFCLIIHVYLKTQATALISCLNLTHFKMYNDKTWKRMWKANVDQLEASAFSLLPNWAVHSPLDQDGLILNCMEPAKQRKFHLTCMLNPVHVTTKLLFCLLLPSELQKCPPLFHSFLLFRKFPEFWKDDFNICG